MACFLQNSLISSTTWLLCGLGLCLGNVLERVQTLPLSAGLGEDEFCNNLQEICTSCFFLLAVSVCMGKGRALWLQLYVSISTILRSLWGYSRGKLCEPVLGIQEGAHI